MRQRIDKGLGAIKAKGSIEPSFPAVHESKVKIEDGKFTPGGTRYQRSTHGADEPAPEWKE